MSALPNAGLLSVRPTLTRSRSSTSPASPSNLSIETSASDLQSHQRPTVARSRSYVSNLEKKPPPTIPLPPIPSEKPLESSRFPRLHLSSKHQHGHDEEGKASHHKKHRYTQSESQQHHRKHEPPRPVAGEVTGSAGQHLGIPSDILYPGSRGAPIPSLMRMRSFRSYRAQPRTEDHASGAHGRDRANSDPKSPSQRVGIPHSKNIVEAQLEKSDLLRENALQNATQSDAKRLDTQLKEAREEVTALLREDNERVSALMHRLDHAHDMLHRTTESLVDTLSSFSSLAQQSSKLLSNFEAESSNLDSSIRKRLRKYHIEICETRTQRIQELEERGRNANRRAGDLEQRLENCRTIVQNWERRETKKRNTWKGVRNGILCGVIIVLLSLLAGFLSWKAIQFSDQTGTPAEALVKMVHHESWMEGSSARANLPEDVRVVLEDISARARNLSSQLRTSDLPDTVQREANSAGYRKNEKCLRLLDEL